MTYAVEYRDMHDGIHYLAICESWHHAQAVRAAMESEETFPVDLGPVDSVPIDYRVYPRLYKGKPVTLANRVGTRLKTDTSFNQVRVDYDIVPDIYGGAA